MPSNVHTNTRDLTGLNRYAGSGHAVTFRCWSCSQPKSTAGSKTLSMGRKVCAACVPKKESK